jgi:hypothetical protein
MKETIYVVLAPGNVFSKAFKLEKDANEWATRLELELGIQGALNTTTEVISVELDNTHNTHLEKFDVCPECLGVGNVDSNCICQYNQYESIELEYEVCNCCGNIIEDGSPANTEFNKKQLKNIK